MLEIIVFLPLIAALAIGLGAPARFSALGASIITLILSLVVAVQFNPNVEGSYQFESSRTFMDMVGFPTLSLAFGIDGISLVLLLLATLVMVAAVLQRKWAAPRSWQNSLPRVASNPLGSAPTALKSTSNGLRM